MVEKIEVVRFKDGYYAVRKEDTDIDDIDDYEYLSLVNSKGWFSSKSYVILYCKGSKRRAVRALKKYNILVREELDYGTPIKEGEDY